MKVLAATDGSKYGRWAIESVSSLPLTAAPVIEVLHVVDVAALRAPFMIQPVLTGTGRYLQAEIKRIEEAAKRTKQVSTELLAALGLSGTVKVARGPVASTIVKHAKRGVGILSVGSRGLDALDRFMLGSTSSHVIHHARSSVLVTKEAPKAVHSLVLAIDGSRASEKAVQWLIRQFNPMPEGLEHEPIMVTVVHVMPKLRYPELREVGRAIVQRSVDKVAKAGFQVQEALRFGKPADEILKVAKQHQVNLIVMGAKELGAISRVLLGSVSTRVVQHATCQVLVVR